MHLNFMNLRNDVAAKVLVPNAKNFCHVDDDDDGSVCLSFSIGLPGWEAIFSFKLIIN